MSNFKKLITVYVSMFSLGLIFVLALLTFITISISKDEAQMKIIKNVEASDFDENSPASEYRLEITPPTIQSKKYVRSSSNAGSVYNFDKYQMTIIDITGQDMDYFYFKRNPPRISSVAQNNSCEIAINASYFAGKREKANHVGLLSIWGKQHVPLGVSSQLTHVAVFDKNTKTMGYFNARKYTPEPTKNTLEFQTGPLVLNDGEIQNHYINNSKHGNYKHKRLLLATNEKNQTFIIVVREKVALGKLAGRLKEIKLLGDTPDVINLDGGSSVALWSRSNPKVNYNAGDTLPLVICVR